MLFLDSVSSLGMGYLAYKEDTTHTHIFTQTYTVHTHTGYVTRSAWQAGQTQT